MTCFYHLAVRSGLAGFFVIIAGLPGVVSVTFGREPRMPLSMVPVSIAGEEGEARLVLLDQQLIAILQRLVGDHYLDDQNRWFIEAAFGAVSDRTLRTTMFDSLEEAHVWFCDLTASECNGTIE